MAKTDMRLPSASTLLNDVLIATALLTRLPVPHANFDSETRPAARAAWAYPLVGILVGGIAVLVGWLATILLIQPEIVAILMVITLTVCTGAMHEDGLADCADGIWGGWDKARRLEIMKDSAIGTYGVMALLFTFAIRLLAVLALIQIVALPLWIIVIPAIMSRAAMVAVMEILPNARDTGLSAQTGRPGKPAMWVALGIGAIAVLCAPISSPAILLLVTATTSAVLALIAKRKIGGQTGDVLGACQVIVEIALLVSFSATAIHADPF